MGKLKSCLYNNFNLNNSLLVIAPFFLLILLFLTVSVVLAAERVERFEEPDIKNDFCGVEVSAQYCKCAFHNEYCSDVGMSKSEANTEVERQFRDWRNKQIYNFATTCLRNGGIWYRPDLTCKYCDDGLIRVNAQCAEKIEGATLAKQYDLPNLNIPIPKDGYRMDARAKVVGARGEVFVYSADFQKWKGPLLGEAILHTGDVVYTRQGSADILFYNSKGARDNVYITPNSTLRLPNGHEKRVYTEPFGMLWDGMIRIYNAVTGSNIEESGGVPEHFIHTPTVGVGVRGTDFVVKHDAETNDSFVVLNEGKVDVFFLEGSEEKAELEPGDSLIASGGKIEVAKLDEGGWNQVLSDNKIPKEKIDTTGVDMDYDNSVNIDPDAVYPPEAVNDLVGDSSSTEVSSEEADDNSSAVGGLVLILLIAAVALFYKKRRKPAKGKK